MRALDKIRQKRRFEMFNEKTTGNVKRFINNPEILSDIKYSLEIIEKNENIILNKMEKK